MPFYDIPTIWEYKQLAEHASKTKPYRNSSTEKPRYPLGNRRYSERFYVPRLDLIQEGYRQEHGSDHDWWYYGPPIEIYYQDRYMLGTFHKDNTFEFNPSYGGYSQGDTGVISSVLPGWIQSKVNYGGLAFHHKQSQATVPVYESLRVRLCDGRPVDEYEMHVYSLDRMKTKPYRKEHDSMFKNALFMFKAMGPESTIEELKQMSSGEVELPIDYGCYDVLELLKSEDPAGVVLWLALRYNINNCKHSFTYNNSWGYKRFLASMGPEPLVRSVKNYFYRELYIRARDKGEEILQTKIYKFGDKMPTTEWGHKIFVNGVERKRLV
jgi:hypothetical protein